MEPGCLGEEGDDLDLRRGRAVETLRTQAGVNQGHFRPFLIRHFVRIMALFEAAAASHIVRSLETCVQQLHVPVRGGCIRGAFEDLLRRGDDVPSKAMTVSDDDLRHRERIW